MSCGDVVVAGRVAGQHGGRCGSRSAPTRSTACAPCSPARRRARAACAPSRGRGPRSTSLPPSPGIQAALATARVAFQAPSSPAPRPSTPPPAAANGARGVAHEGVHGAQRGGRGDDGVLVVQVGRRAPPWSRPARRTRDATWAAPPAVATTMPSSSPARSMVAGPYAGLPCGAWPRPSIPSARACRCPAAATGAGVTVTPMRTAEMLTQPRFFQRPSGPLPTAARARAC